MKKQKPVEAPPTFAYKNLTHKQVVALVNEEFPISLRKNEDLINRIYERYPIIEKAEIAIIVKAIFSSIRDNLILGRLLRFREFIGDVHLHFCTYPKNGVKFPVLIVKIKTPAEVRKIEQA